MKLTSEEAKLIVNEDTHDWEPMLSKMTGQRRWVTEYTSVHKHIESGKYYMFNYDRGSTEKCDEQPFEWVDTYTPVEVTKIEEVVWKWVEVK